MKELAFYLGLGTLFTHELDAMPNHEWQILPVLRNWTDSVGEVVFIVAHVPIFAIIFACIASLNSRTRTLARDIASGFLIVHALLHLAFSRHPAYEFGSLLSDILIYGAAVCGLSYLLALQIEKKSQASR